MTEPSEARELPPGYPPSLASVFDELGPDGVSDEDAALLPYQREWAYDRTSPIKVSAKSRRIGITWATAYEAVEVACCTREHGGMDVWYMANAQDDARDFIDDCASWVRWLSPIFRGLPTEASEELINDDDRDILAYTIRFASGFKIRALTSKPRRLRGKEGYAILDEAAHHDDLGAWLKAAAAFRTWGGRLALISTYNGVENEFYELAASIRSGKRKQATLYEVDIHKAIAQGLYRRICRSRHRTAATAEGLALYLEELRDLYGDDFAEELECIPSTSGGTFIPRELVLARCVLGPAECDVLEFNGRILENGGIQKSEWTEATDPLIRAQEMRNWLDVVVLPVVIRLHKQSDPVFAGIDFGRVHNLTTAIFATLRRDMVRSLRLVIELEAVPHAQQDQVLDYIWHQLKGRLKGGIADAGGLGGPSAERCQDKTRGKVKAVGFTERWHAAHWEGLKARFEDASIELPRHFRPMVDDLAALRRIGGKVKIVAEKKSKDGRGQIRHGDSASALEALEAAVGSDNVLSAEQRLGGRVRRKVRRR